MVKEIIDRYAMYDVEYGPGYTNHLPMALVALEKIGAGGKNFENFADNYVERLKLLPESSITIDMDNWKHFLGAHKHYSSYIQFFQKESEKLGPEGLIKKYVNYLLDGISSALFHCLIKLAYAVETNNEQEIIRGIAYLTTNHTPLGEVKEHGKEETAAEILQKLQENTGLKESYSAMNAGASMSNVSRDPIFIEGMEWPCFNAQSIAELAKIVRYLYLSSPNLVTLHMITGTHALRILLPYIEDRITALNYHWLGLCSAYVSIGRPIVHFKGKETEESWEDIFKKARTTFDPHVVKLVYSCSQEQKIYPDPIYRTIAAYKVNSG